MGKNYRKFYVKVEETRETVIRKKKRNGTEGKYYRAEQKHTKID